jgi:hypothetical protein
VATAEQVRALLDAGLDHEEIGRRLGLPAGQVYLIGTGIPADGGHSADGTGARPGARPSSQDLANPPHENPTSKQVVHSWIRGRVLADDQQRRAGARQEVRQEESG